MVIDELALLSGNVYFALRHLGGGCGSEHRSLYEIQGTADPSQYTNVWLSGCQVSSVVLSNDPE